MRTLQMLSAVSVLAGLAAAASDVLTLTKTTFKQQVEPSPLMLVEFFAPWWVATSVLQVARS